MKSLTGNIPENLCIFAKSKKLEKGYWDDFDMDGDCEGLEVLSSFVTDATNKKTQETAKNWADGKGFRKIDKPNLPMKNLRIVSLEKRCEGGRAWKILTEDNLWLDLREDVLLDAIQNESIKKGVLGGEYIFAVVGSQMKIIRIGSELHKRVLAYLNRKETKEIQIKDFRVGHIYSNKNSKRFLFLGKWDAITFDVVEANKPSSKKFDHCFLIALDRWNRDGKLPASYKYISSNDLVLVKSPVYIEDLGEFKDYDKIIPMFIKDGARCYLDDIRQHGHRVSWLPHPIEVFNGRPAGDGKILHDNYDDCIEAMKTFVKTV